ncbi:CDP-alcohol phosphatidyltransferase family protein, partial [Patescibacteria group bacterium]|nr:CDP-alcohol phosphatidyltransferase family protein [Patescibacteria group bacterium]
YINITHFMLTYSRSNHSKEFQKANKIFWHDKFLAATILKLIPEIIKPNHLTVFRIIATPAVVVLMVYEQYYIGLIAFLFIAFTDALDGSMARTRNQITEWGKIYDPLADKILIGSMVFAIVLRYIDVWTAVAIVVIEIVFIITAWIRIKKQDGKIVQANIWGKIKMFLQVAGVVILLLAIINNWASLLPFASYALYLAIAFAIVSLLTHGI